MFKYSLKCKLFSFLRIRPESSHSILVSTIVTPFLNFLYYFRVQDIVRIFDKSFVDVGTAWSLCIRTTAPAESEDKAGTLKNLEKTRQERQRWKSTGYFNNYVTLRFYWDPKRMISGRLPAFDPICKSFLRQKPKFAIQHEETLCNTTIHECDVIGRKYVLTDFSSSVVASEAKKLPFVSCDINAGRGVAETRHRIPTFCRQNQANPPSSPSNFRFVNKVTIHCHFHLIGGRQKRFPGMRVADWWCSSKFKRKYFSRLGKGNRSGFRTIGPEVGPQWVPRLLVLHLFALCSCRGFYLPFLTLNFKEQRFSKNNVFVKMYRKYAERCFTPPLGGVCGILLKEIQRTLAEPKICIFRHASVSSTYPGTSVRRPSITLSDFCSVSAS